MKNHPITLPATLPESDAITVRRLWDTLVGFGVPEGSPPSNCSQALPYIENNRDCYRAYLTESLFTGLYTRDRDIALRSYAQACGYMGRLRGMGDEPGAYISDVLASLRTRVERHFLHGEGV